MRKVIVNTTPLIALAGIGHLNVLEKLYGEVTIPRAVYNERLCHNKWLIFDEK